MKKFYFYFLIFVLSANQLVNSQNYRLGIGGGINSCSLFGINAPVSYDKQYSYSGGFYLDSRIAQHLSTLTELKFARYKFNFTEPIPLVDSSLLSIQEKTNFLTVPVLLRYKRGYEFAFYYVNVGMQFSMLLNNNRTSSLIINNLNVDPDYYYNFQHNLFSYGLVAGIGFQIKAVNMDLRYYYSTRNMYKRKDSREMRYNILSLEMYYQFNYKDATPFGRKTGWKGFKYKIKHLFK